MFWFRATSVDMLLGHMLDESKFFSELLDWWGFPVAQSVAQAHIAARSKANVKIQERGASLTPFLTAPNVLHGESNLPNGAKFDVLTDPHVVHSRRCR